MGAATCRYVGHLDDLVYLAGDPIRKTAYESALLPTRQHCTPHLRNREKPTLFWEGRPFFGAHAHQDPRAHGLKTLDRLSGQEWARIFFLVPELSSGELHRSPRWASASNPYPWVRVSLCVSRSGWLMELEEGWISVPVPILHHFHGNPAHHQFPWFHLKVT